MGLYVSLCFLLTPTLTLKSCENLWEEAEVLGFDLSWLAPSIENVWMWG